MAAADIPADAHFELPAEHAEQLLTNGMAKLADEPLGKAPAAAAAPVVAANKEKTVATRLLVDCEHGKANDVAHLPAAEAKQMEAAGHGDTNKAAVAYALSQAKPAQ